MRPALYAVACLFLAGCASSPAESPGIGVAGTMEARAPAFDVEGADIAALSARMQAGQLTSRDLVLAYLDRISRLDDAGPRLQSVLALNPNAVREAEALDAERRAGRVRGPLHGIPVLLKDNIDARPMATTAGSLALAQHVPNRDAFLTERLRAAGAVILGKTNLSEWANFRSSNSISGWSAVGGQTRNPHVLDRNPCGSSSGSGTAAAASLAAATVGTETDGSIICPAAVSGVVGLKPTVGLVSRHGIVPISGSQDTAGPMTRSVADAARLLSVLAAPDTRDPAHAAVERPASIDYSLHLKAGALKGARIGVLRKNTGYHPGVDSAFEQALAALQGAGAELVDAEIPTAGKWGSHEFAVLLAEFKPALEAYLAESGAPVRTLAELIEFNRRHPDTELKYFGQELFEQTLKAPGIESAKYRTAREAARRLAGPQGIDAALRKHRLDALVAPSTAPAWRTDTVLGDHFSGAGYGAAAVAGYPSITVPMGDIRGLPVGIVFMGTRWSEPRLIELAYGYEQATQLRRTPRFLETVDSLDGP